MGRGLLLLLVVVTGLLMLTESPWFHYASVSAEGDPRLTAELSPLIPDTNPLFFPYAAIRKSLMRADASIEGVHFQPTISNRLALEITFDRRVPMALVRRKGRVFGLDRRGIPFEFGDTSGSVPKRHGGSANAKSGPFSEKSEKSGTLPGMSPIRVAPTGVPEIELLAPMRLLPGKPIEAGMRGMIAGILPILDSMKNFHVSRIVLNPGNQWMFFTKSGVCIRAGFSEGLLERLALLPPILQVAGRQKYKRMFVDLSTGSEPIVSVVR